MARKRNMNLQREETRYRPSARKRIELQEAVSRYNLAVNMAREGAGFGKFNIGTLATETTVPNALYRAKNLKELNRLISRLNAFSKPGATNIVYDVDEQGNPINIMFKAQREALESELRRENYVRAKMRKAAKQDQTIYNPNIDVELKPYQLEDIIRTRTANVLDVSTTDLTVLYRTQLWRENYLNKFIESSLLLYQEPLTDNEEDQIQHIRELITTATPEEISYMIYNEGAEGEIRSGPYAENLLSRLDALEAAWERAHDRA